MAARPIVTLDGVTKNYGTFRALERTDLTLAEGEFVTLLGPSGCGKTTTLRLIGGFEHATSGRIQIDGRDMTESAAYLRPVNTVFQDYALFPHMTVAENIAYGLNRRDPTVAGQVSDALDLVGLGALRDRNPHQLSGGQKQRVAMARAIVRRPRVLLLDEPLSALDVKLREGMQIELKRIHRELGIAFLMVTHDQGEAMSMSDRIVVMQSGKIRQIGRPEELYDAPASPYVADFIGGSNLIDATHVTRDGELHRIELAGGIRLQGIARDGRGFATGAPLVAALRPEALRLGPGENTIPCRITEVNFQGDRIRLEVIPTGSSARLSVQVQRVGLTGGEKLTHGADVTLSIAPKDVMLFPAEAS
ncbi:ABC transporter ATP-binding protein [Paracoccus aestuariivivens]|uniref:ATP-binding cassette domain-containing protein n=1 Tax=Paracoccus aestuariivivens TaxID=1820333 RepID=A0A6L6JIR2_9RHOB|nr:ABC transporter ATP-binding protein [Paracoccus aestuariivivens]MTH79751.1 ATP-binding cassette domain-containing protein [Paracoccus aestuariivivens]